MTAASVDVIAPANVAFDTRVSTGVLVVFAAEGAAEATAVVAAMRDRMQFSSRLDDLASAWRAGAAAAGSGVLSALVGIVRGGSATFIHAGDLGVHAVGSHGAKPLVRPHAQVASGSSWRVRTRAIGLPGNAARGELTEARLDGVATLVISTASVWASLAERLDDELRAASGAADLVSRAAVIESPIARAFSRVPRGCIWIALPPASRAAAEPGVVQVASQRTARRAIRAVLCRTVGARAAVLVAPRGAGKSTVLGQLGRAGMVDQSATVYTPGQLRKELKTGALAGVVVVDRILDALGGDASLAASLCEVIAQGRVSLVTTATPTEWAALTADHGRLTAQLTRIELGPPAPAELLDIVTAWLPRFADRHHVSIEPESARAAVELTARFALGRAQPESALFALEQACLHAGHAGIVTNTLSGRGGGTVKRASVLAAIADLQGVAVELVEPDEDARAQALAARLSSRLHGQHAAAKQIAALVRRGIERQRRGGTQPLASCLLLGPTGTGKTETARLLAECWYADRRAITTIDASEYREPASVFRLTGAPPGHIGYGEPSPLAAAMRANPHRVVLFDELEKACSEFHLLLLQILDSARLTTSTGDVIAFSDAIVVMTSNLEAETPRVGFGHAEHRDPDDTRRRRLAEHLRPELVARIDEVVQYAALTPEAALAIALGHFARCTNALVAASRLQPSRLPQLRQRVLADVRSADLAGGARGVLRLVDRILADERAAQDRATAATVIYPYLDAGRERLAAGLVVELDGAVHQPTVERVLTHPAGGSLLYVAYDASRVIVLVGDEGAATELASSVADLGAARTATGRVRSDISGRPIGELLERLLAR